MLQRVDLADRIAVEPLAELRVTGFATTRSCARALEALAAAAGVEPPGASRSTKRIPVAAGLGGGSSDAATRAPACERRARTSRLRMSACTSSPPGSAPTCRISSQTAPSSEQVTARRSTPVELPQDYWIVLVVPRDAAKASTASVYAHFDERQRRTRLSTTAAQSCSAHSTASSVRGTSRRCRRNDLASSPLARQLEQLGAFRADVTGAGPTVYGLFLDAAQAHAAQREISPVGRTWITAPAWYR